MRVKITGYAYLDIPEELKGKDFDEIEEELQDDISDIDCGVLEGIDSECEEII
jgi:hypothetical protein